MKKLVLTIFFFIIVSFNLNTNLYSDITDQLIKLDDLYQKGSITNKEYKKAKSIILKMEENKDKKIEKVKSIKKDNDQRLLKTIEIQKYKTNVGEESMELMEMIVGDFRIYSHRPGGIKVRRISTGEQLLVISDKFKIKYYGDSENIFEIDKKDDKNEPKLTLKLKKIPVLRWDGKYVPKHRAYFYQVMAIGNKPFQYYIQLAKKGQKIVALNMAKFDRKIDSAVAKAKTRLAAKYEISVDDINKIMEDRDRKTMQELEDVVQKEEQKILEASLNTAVDEAINEELAEELARTIGEAMAAEFINTIESASGEAIDQAIEDEIASAIDAAIAEAVAAGVDQATFEAALQAVLEVYARGGSDAEAMAACQATGYDGC